MAKATKKAPENAPVDQEGCLILRGELFWKWKAADSEQRYVVEALKVKQAEFDALLDQYPEVKAALGERTALIQRSVAVQVEVRNVNTELEKYLGIPMKNVSIDDQTGRVFQHNSTGGEPVPVKPKARSKKNKVGG
jgi:hypothetical protein